jgi:hypothetical protein
MPSASFALQAAVFAALADDAPLTSLLGEVRIYDDVPPRPAYPYLTFGRSSERDWSTGTDAGTEHVLTLHVWSMAAGRKEAQAIAAAAEAALHDRALTLAGHRLVNLRHEYSEVRRDADGETIHGIIRFRAVTEPL